jgi:hypothetical protein
MSQKAYISNVAIFHKEYIEALLTTFFIWYQEFKLNPNAKAFTPSFSSPRPASPMMQSPIYMHASLPPATSLQGVPLQYMQQQPVQSAQFTQYHNAMAAAAAAAASGAGPYMQQPGGFVSGFPGGGMPQVIPGQPSMKIPAHSQQQVFLIPWIFFVLSWSSNLE